MSVGTYPRNASGRESRNASGRAYRNTSASAMACCCGPTCVVCTGATPPVWEIAFTGITKCPGFTGLGGNPNITFPNADEILIDTGPDACVWSDEDDVTSPIQKAFISVEDTGSPDLASISQLDSDLAGQAWFKGLDAAFDGDCESPITVNNRVAVVGDCGLFSVRGYGGSATATPQFPP